MTKIFSLKEKLWIYPGKAAWHFISIPSPIAEEIDFLFAHVKRGFGSLPVQVSIGQTKWQTSIFPDKKSSVYLLPLKKSIRDSEKVKEGDAVSFVVKISD